MKNTAHSFGKMIRDSRGVAAVEFALIAPMLLIILAGLVDYGMYAHQQMQVQELSRRAAEYVVQGGQESNVQADIINTSDFYNTPDANRTSLPQFSGTIACECANGIASTDPTCKTPCPTDGDYLRSYYEAKVTATYTPIIPWTGLSSTITLTGYSRLQYAR